MGIVPALSPTRSWGKRRRGAASAGPVAAAAAAAAPLLPLLLLAQLCAGFNLDTERRVVFTGPRGSYFGYSVEFVGNASR